jgi:hypothetical protein
MMADWRLDQGYHLDASYGAETEITVEFEVDIAYQHNLTGLEFTIEIDFDADVEHTIALDLLPLIPEKYRESPILQDYVDQAELLFGSALSKSRDLIKLVSPDTISSAEYMRHLGALIGVNFPAEDESTLSETRKILSDAVDWYKIKGAYQSVGINALSHSLTVNLYDMYTKDYSNFVLTDWFVGDENENPPGLDSSYYKSPHFGLEVVLDQAYTVGSLKYLWQGTYMDNLILQVEDTRPVHTVPHFIVLLNPKTDEFGNIIQTDTGEIKTKVTSNWVYGTKYFDATGSLNSWNFDGSMSFDSDQVSLIKSINKWVLGIGNYPGGLTSGSLDVQVPVLTGTIEQEDIVLYEDRYEFEFIVPKSIVQSSISELGLYVPGTPDILMVLSAFPRIDKVSTTELRVVVEVWKEDLSI